MALDKVPDRRKQYDPAKHGTVPIHGLGSNRLRRGEKTENEEGTEKAERDDVDGYTPTTK